MIGFRLATVNAARQGIIRNRTRPVVRAGDRKPEGSRGTASGAGRRRAPGKPFCRARAGTPFHAIQKTAACAIHNRRDGSLLLIGPRPQQNPRLPPPSAKRSVPGGGARSRRNRRGIVLNNVFVQGALPAGARKNGLTRRCLYGIPGDFRRLDEPLQLRQGSRFPWLVEPVVEDLRVLQLVVPRDESGREPGALVPAIRHEPVHHYGRVF